MTTAVTGGARVAELRKARAITQVALARRAGISVSLLSKIEIWDRTLTPGVAAAIAGALQLSLGALYGEATVSADQSVQLENLRTAVRRYDLPDQAPASDIHGELVIKGFRSVGTRIGVPDLGRCGLPRSA